MMVTKRIMAMYLKLAMSLDARVMTSTGLPLGKTDLYRCGWRLRVDFRGEPYKFLHEWIVYNSIPHQSVFWGTLTRVSSGEDKSCVGKLDKCVAWMHWEAKGSVEEFNLKWFIILF